MNFGVIKSLYAFAACVHEGNESLNGCTNRFKVLKFSEYVVMK